MLADFLNCLLVDSLLNSRWAVNRLDVVFPDKFVRLLKEIIVSFGLVV